MKKKSAEVFFRTAAGEEAKLYTITDGRLIASFTDWGATLTTLLVPDGTGFARDVVLGYDNPAMYETNPGCLGSTVGRYANRIGGGHFTLNGKTYSLVRNEKDRTTLHGGAGFSHRLWHVKEWSDKALTFAIHSPAGDAGFPGALDLEVTYKLTAKDELRIEYAARSSADTVVNFTNHAYFNLDGNGTIAKQKVRIQAGFYTEVNRGKIPTGWLCRVNNTAFDLRKLTAFGKVMDNLPRGIDHNYVLNRECAKMKKAAAKAVSSDGKITMECFTTEPGLQLYTAGGLKSSIHLKYGAKGKPFAAFCLETQHFPDSPNQPSFPSTVLKKGDRFTSTTVYRFLVKK